jgi:mannose-6-phosphate isomerase-like protein (cupin superfamily)
MITIGTTKGQPWIEAIPTAHHSFEGRTFSRFHLAGDDRVPGVAELWVTPDHSVDAHAHDVDELFYVLSGSIEINGKRLDANDTVFIPRGTPYDARVLEESGSRVLRIALSSQRRDEGVPEYEAKLWRGPLTEDGLPDLSSET